MTGQRYNSRPHHLESLASSPTPYAPRISSPLATHHSSSASSPVSYVSSYSSAHLSSPSQNDCVPLSDLPEPEPASDDTEMQLDDPFSQPDFSHLGQPSIGKFNPTASSSPGPSWLPSLAPPRNPTAYHASPAGPITSNLSRRSAAFKQPVFSSARRSSSSVHSSDPSSSPTPLSNASSKPGSSPSQLRQQAANRIRSQQRNGMLSNRRILLDAFLPDGQGSESELAPQEYAMMEAISRKEIFNTRRQWQRGFTSLDELLATQVEQDRTDAVNDQDPPSEEEIDPSQMYEAYQHHGPDLSMHQDQQLESRPSLSTLLTSPPAICPACKVAGLGCTDSGVQCLSCAWGLGTETLFFVDQQFHNHGSQPMHSPVVAYNQHFGTTVMCSHPACDEIMAL